MSNTTKSLSMTVPANMVDDCNRLMRALGRDDTPDPGQTFTVEMSPDGLPAPTRYGAHTYDDDLVAILDNGVIPGNINWQTFELNKKRARTAFEAISYHNVPDRNSLVNFAVEMQKHDVERIREP